MDALQAHIQSYGNAMDSLDAYKQQADKDFFDNWMSKVDEINKKVEAVGRGLEATGTSIEGAKLLKKGGQYIANKLKGKGENTDANETTGDDAGSGGGGDSSAGTSATENGRTGANAEGQEGADGDADAGGQDFEWFDDPESGLGSEPIGVGGQTASPEDLARFQTGTQTELPTGAQSAPDPTSGGGEATGSHTGPDAMGDDGVNPLEPKPLSLGSSEGAEGPTLEGAPESVIEGTAGDVAPALGEGATAGVEGATGAIEGVVGGLSTAMDFLGPIGLLAGLGVELYEAFHKTPEPPKPPQAISSRTKGAVVLPTFDAVQDTPASASAF